ncbi:DUF4333 domain-containing protein [Streptomyces sp. NPDC046862]|uniref:DUF4333 domain-containing protein n=1 Tax=Streptomyces sp. NPDC046862 TaxID=3154603 RepID=UPI0034541AF1
MQRSFLVGAVGGVAVVGALAGVLTYLAAGKNMQHTEVERIRKYLYVKVDGHPAVHHGVLESRIEGWYHPLPWVGQEIRNVSCPNALPAVVGASETCTAKAGGKRITIPVRTVKVTGSADEPTVFWKFER